MLPPSTPLQAPDATQTVRRNGTYGTIQNSEVKAEGMAEHRVRVDRPAFTIKEMEKKYNPKGESNEKYNALRDWAPFKTCSGKCLLHQFLSFLPFLTMMRNYKIKTDLIGDIGAGVSLAVVHIPQSLGFALLSGLPPEYGLYSSFFQPLIYFFFSTSRHTSMGTMAVISLVVGAAVHREIGSLESNGVTQSPINITDLTTSVQVTQSATSPSVFTDNTTTLPNLLGDGLSESVTKAIGIATCLTFLVGIMQLAMSLLRLGWVTTFMPPSFLGGFTTACAFYIAASQIKPFLGINVKTYVGIFRFGNTITDACRKLPTTHPATAVTSVICLVFLIFIKEFINIKFSSKLKFPIPADFIIVVVSILASYYMELHNKWGVAVIGNVATGFPVPKVPPLEYSTIVLTDAAIAAVLCFVISFSLATVFTTKYGYHLNINQELLAYGMTHLGSSFFNCFAGSSAPPRIFLYEAAGGKTGLAHLISSVIILIVIMVVGPLFWHLPKCVLASVIVVAIGPLFKQFAALKLYWKVCKLDFVIFTFTLLIMTLTDIGIGLGICLIFVLVSSIIQFIWSKGHVMGVLNNQDLTGELNQFSASATTIPGVKIFRFEATLFYITVPRFKNELYSKICNPRRAISEEEHAETDYSEEHEMEPKKIEAKDVHGETLHAVIIDCSAFNFVDIMGINCLKTLYNDFHAVNVQFILCQCSPGFLKRIHTSGLLTMEDLAIYPTIQDAIAQFWSSSLSNITNVI